MQKKNGFLKVVFMIIILMLVSNLILSLISTFLPVSFVKPHSIIEAPEIMFSLPIGGYILNINQTIVNTWVIMVILIAVLILGTRKLSVENPGFFQLLLEEYYHFIENSFVYGFGEYKSKFMGFFSAMFSMLLLTNISMFLFPFVLMWKREEHGIMFKPFFRTATADLNTTVGLAAVVFVIFVTIAFIKKGFLGFMKELCQPFFLMFPINVIGEFAKPINISMRLFGNMFAGLVIMALIYGLGVKDALPKLTNNILKGSFTFAIGWPNLLQLYLDLFVGIIQAFVFTVLSSVYIRQMLEDEHEED